MFHTFNFVGNIDVPAFLSFQAKAAPAFLSFQPKAAPAFPPEKSIPPHCRSLAVGWTFWGSFIAFL
jgi:hypothetical protein